ncbi:class I SAM-dependent methyltransferase [Candidatus Kaiserbacteria bacterium]|nr:class I SAM-dependent methyltransferase [Candidatus Kaiserbacteria bacterium]
MNWTTYLEKTAGRKHSPILEKALSYVHTGHRALDLGSGAGNDARFLIGKGFMVDAVDSNPESQRFLLPEVDFVQSTFDTYMFPLERYDLINAQLALPFNSPETFNDMFEKLTKSLKCGGIFAGQFFGLKDAWAERGKITVHTHEEIHSLLQAYEVHLCKEEYTRKGTVQNGDKVWHIFHVIAERRT